MIRLFVGLEIPEPMRDLMPMMAEGVPGVNWVPDENMHLTLRYIGEVNEAVARDIDDVLSTVDAPPFDLTLHGVDTFGGRTPHALYVGVRPNPALLQLQAKVETALLRLGLPHVGRKFAPHVTIARLNHAPELKLAEFIQNHSLFSPGPFNVAEFHLYSSVLTHNASIYTSERTYALN